jgi:hypothetical protein
LAVLTVPLAVRPQQNEFSLISSAIVNYAVSVPPLSSVFPYTGSGMVVSGVDSKCTSPVGINTDAVDVVAVSFDWTPDAKWILLQRLASLYCEFARET